MSAADQSHHYEVLARKHRPQRFADLIGQQHVAGTLQNAIRAKKLAHAFLFTGIRGVGKTTAARLLARALNCRKTDEPTPEPCADPKAVEACETCREIADSRSLDVAEIDGASNRGIDSIRELNENVRYQPASARYRVYIIDEAHMVTREGFNALLKTLEEPPPHVKFIFATTAIDKFPDTIVSRCQRYDFRRIPLRQIADHLRQIADAEKVTIPDAALYVIGREAQGSMRDAESLLDRMIAFCGETIAEEKVAEVLGVTERGTLFEVAEAVLRGDAKKALELLDGIHGAGRDLERFSRELLEHWRNLVVAALYDGGGEVLRDVPAEELTELARQAELRPLGDIQRLFRVARQADEELRGSDLARFVLEMSLVRMATLEPVVAVDEVLSRLESVQGGASTPAGSRGGAGTPSSPVRPASPTRTGPGAGRSPREGSPPTVRDAPSPPRRADPPPVTAAAAPRPPGGNDAAVGGWQGLLQFVQERRLSLYFTLSHARVVEETPGKLVLGVAAEKFRRELESPGTLSQVESLASEFHGTAVRVSIVSVEEGRAPIASPAPTAAETLENPAVRRAVEVLGGEVREVRNRR